MSVKYILGFKNLKNSNPIDNVLNWWHWKDNILEYWIKNSIKINVVGVLSFFQVWLQENLYIHGLCLWLAVLFLPEGAGLAFLPPCLWVTQ